MDINKSLYMADFLQMRDNLGSIESYSVKNILFTNLYDEMQPRLVTEVVKAVEDTGKTIMVLEKTGQPVGPLPELFSDLPDEDSVPEIKIVHVHKDVKPSKDVEPVKVVESELKQIVINPQYVPMD